MATQGVLDYRPGRLSQAFPEYDGSELVIAPHLHKVSWLHTHTLENSKDGSFVESARHYYQQPQWQPRLTKSHRSCEQLRLAAFLLLSEMLTRHDAPEICNVKPVQPSTSQSHVLGRSR